VITWPSTDILPRPATDLGGKIDPSTIRSKMDTGRVRQRQRFTTGNRTVNVSWELTDAQWKIFQGVYHFYLNDGADWFLMELPLGDGLKTYTVRFTDSGLSYKYVDVLNWKVSATLETETVCPVSKADLDALLTP